MPVLSLPPLFDRIAMIDGGFEPAAAAPAKGEASAFTWPDWQLFGPALGVLRVVSSAVLLLMFLGAALRVRGIMGKAQALTIGGQSVLVSDRLGPAVLGFFRPRIVLPPWLAEADPGLRSQVLNHEREHIAAHDQLTLLGGLLLVAVMPWNIALWWQLRRLRAAIEVDCDRHVLRASADARDYAQALLAVGRRSRGAPFATVALTEPVSELETRIRIMLDKARDFSLAGLGARVAIVAAVLSLALALNAPHAQQANDNPQATLTIGPSVFQPLGDAQACLDRDDTECVRRALDEIVATPDLTGYETARLQNYYAYTYVHDEDVTGAIGAYEAILALPQSTLTENLRSTSMKALAMLYRRADRLQDGLDMYDRWLALPGVDAWGNNQFVRARFLYQLERYPEAIAETELAIATADKPRKEWYETLYALQSMTGDEQGAASTLESLDRRWPDRERSGAAAPVQPAPRGTPFAEPAEFLPIDRVEPVYPPRARARGLEGYVVVRYTVTATGAAKDVEVVDSSTTLFIDAAVEAARQYRYKPRVIDGVPVEVAGVTSRIVFELPDED